MTSHNFCGNNPYHDGNCHEFLNKLEDESQDQVGMGSAGLGMIEALAWLGPDQKLMAVVSSKFDPIPGAHGCVVEVHGMGAGGKLTVSNNSKEYLIMNGYVQTFQVEGPDDVYYDYTRADETEIEFRKRRYKFMEE